MVESVLKNSVPGNDSSNYSFEITIRHRMEVSRSLSEYPISNLIICFLIIIH